MVLAALAGSAQDAKLGRGVNFYSVQKEAAMGASLATEIRRQTTPLGSTMILDYVNRIGSRLAAQIPDAPFPYTFAVVAGDLTNPGHEPVAVPGGYIFVPSALILEAKDEAEFAGVLAHSMAHAAERHATRLATRGELANQSTIPLIFMGGWAGYAAGQSNGVLIPVSTLQFQRKLEMDADALAVTTTFRAGFDPSALVRYIGRVPATQPGTAGKVFALQPTPEERISAMESALKALPQPIFTTPEPAEFESIQAEVRKVQPVVTKPLAYRATLKKKAN